MNHGAQTGRNPATDCARTQRTGEADREDLPAARVDPGAVSGVLRGALKRVASGLRFAAFRLEKAGAGEVDLSATVGDVVTDLDGEAAKLRELAGPKAHACAFPPPGLSKSQRAMLAAGLARRGRGRPRAGGG